MPALYDYHLLNGSLIVGALLVAVGAVGFVTRRNLVIMLISAGIMLQGVMLTMTAFGGFHGTVSGAAFALLLLVVAAAATGGMFAVAGVFAARERSLDVSRWRVLGRPESREVEATRTADGDDAPNG